MDIIYNVGKLLILSKNCQLPVGAGTFFQRLVYQIDNGATTQVVYYIIHKIKESPAQTGPFVRRLGAAGLAFTMMSMVSGTIAQVPGK